MRTFLLACALAGLACPAHAAATFTYKWQLTDGQCYDVWAAASSNIVSIDVQNFAKPPAYEAWIYPARGHVNPLYPVSAIFRAYGTGLHGVVLHCAGSDCSGLYRLTITPVGAPLAC